MAVSGSLVAAYSSTRLQVETISASVTAGRLEHLPQRFFHGGRRKGQPLADFHRGCVMAQADDDDMHGLTTSVPLRATGR